MKRVVFDVILIISVFIFPWWINVFLLLAGVFIFKNFYEFMLVSVIVFSLFSVKGDRIISSPIFFSAIVIISFILTQIIRNNIILYKNDISH